MKIYLGTDHAGFALKEKLVSFLGGLGYEVVDMGAKQLDSSDDYPDYISLVAREISADQNAKGVILGYSGQGEAIVANRFKNVRAVVFYGGSMEIIKLSREHNDANVLSLGAHFLDEKTAEEAVKLWLDTDFSDDERHVRRIAKIESVSL